MHSRYLRRSGVATSAVVLIVLGTLFVFAALFFLMKVSYSNNEISLRNQIKAKQTDNKNEYDNVVKKISQSGQVTQEQAKQIANVVVGYANARAGNPTGEAAQKTGSGAALINAVHEAVPSVPTEVFVNLQNIIVGSRDAFTMRQKELLDLNRQHDNAIDLFPSSFFVGDRSKIEVQIVTSTRTQNAFDTGTDDDTNVFAPAATPVPHK